MSANFNRSPYGPPVPPPAGTEDPAAEADRQRMPEQPPHPYQQHPAMNPVIRRPDAPYGYAAPPEAAYYPPASPYSYPPRYGAPPHGDPSAAAAMYAAQHLRSMQQYGYPRMDQPHYPYGYSYPPQQPPVPSSHDMDPYKADDFEDKGKKMVGGKLKKPMYQKITTTLGKPKSSARLVVKDGTTVIEDGDNQWYTGCVPLGLEDDKYWLSELQVYLRSNFAEAFGATEEDIAAPMHGRNKPIALGQVGIRCMHCKHDNPAERGQQATSYPSLISGIYNSVQQMLRLHLDCCLSMPPEVRAKIEQLKLSCSSRGGRKQYWVDSARRLGLVDTDHGIHFGRDPMGPLPPLAGPSVNCKENRSSKKKNKNSSKNDMLLDSDDLTAQLPPVDDRPLVFPADKPLISDFLYLTLEQMAPCTLMEADRVGCYKTRRVGFPGLACRHCVGQAGCGRYFPASEASLSQTTTSQTIMNHVRNCRRCPIEIRENLDIMKRNRVGPDGKRSDKPKHGGRKVFFHRLWCRIQNLPLEEDDMDTSLAKRIGRPKKFARKKKEESDDDETEAEGESTGESESEHESDDDDTSNEPSPWVHGCVRLTKSDDVHWLSEMECFARNELIEVFSVKDLENDAAGYGGRKKPAIGQVGIRCVFSKTLDPSERPSNCVVFPENLSAIPNKVKDMIRLHFPSCCAISDEAKETFKRLKGFDAKVGNDDSHQYWVDSARDIGLANIPPGGEAHGSWGITFRRDPLEPSPADELDLALANEDVQLEYGPNMIVKEEDRGTCTDQILFIFRQVRPCQFKKSDRRAGPGARGRDRTMGFPGLCCVHSAGKTNSGRFFPVSAKNLTDSTANALATYIATCNQCPEPIKASIAYLGHRAIRQKSELGGSWKKTFFKKIWDRLHTDREWTSIDDEIAQAKEDAGLGEAAEVDNDETEEEDGSKDGMGNQMNALIKAAAIWLNKQDAATEPKGRKKRSTDEDPDSPSKKRRTTRNL